MREGEGAGRHLYSDGGIICCDFPSHPNPLPRSGGEGAKAAGASKMARKPAVNYDDKTAFHALGLQDAGDPALRADLMR